MSEDAELRSKRLQFLLREREGVAAREAFSEVLRQSCGQASFVPLQESDEIRIRISRQLALWRSTREPYAFKGAATEFRRWVDERVSWPDRDGDFWIAPSRASITGVISSKKCEVGTLWWELLRCDGDSLIMMSSEFTTGFVLQFDSSLEDAYEAESWSVPGRDDL